MGQTLSTRFEWREVAPVTSAAAAGGDAAAAGGATGSTSSLKTSITNQDLLYDLVKMLEQICRVHVAEARAEFRRPLQWTTSMRPATFAGIDKWTVQSAGKNAKGGSVSSVDLRADGTPLFQLEPAGNGFTARAASFEVLNRALRLSEDDILKEAQEIIQANRDPVKIIFGVTGENALAEAFDAVNNEPNARKREQYGKLYKLLLVVNAFDLQLMKTAVKDLQKDKVLSIHAVTEELLMLQSFAGHEATKALVSIDWESDYTFANGYKAPPWRQVHGELCYIQVQTFDVSKFIVTASKKGYFVNKGYATNEKGEEILDYDAISNTFPALIDLLRDRSPVFNKRIDEQRYTFAADERAAGAAEDEPGHHHEADEASEEVDTADDLAARKGEQHRTTRTAHAVRKTKAKNGSKPRAAEPSLKWRALGADAGKTVAGGMVAGWHAKPVTGRTANKPGSAGKDRKSRRHAEEEEEFSDSGADDSEEEMQEKRQDISELPAEYYAIQKLVKYLRGGNQTATIIAICSLRDFDLTNEFNQTAIRDLGGLETLVNLLDTDDPKCKVGALKILKDVSQNVATRSALSDLDAMHPLVELLRDSEREPKCLAAETIAHCAKNARNRRSVRRYGGIKRLVRLLKARPGSEDEQVAMAGALALAALSKSERNKEAIQAAGSIPLLANLLNSHNEQLLIPVVGILQEGATDANCRMAIRSSGMIRFLVANLASKNEELQTHCASAIFKCAEEDETRTLVRQYNGLSHLVNLLDNTMNKELLAAATGAVWKCAQNLENVAALNKLNTIKKLVGLMENQPEDVLVNVVGALGACAQTVDGRLTIKDSNGITPLVNLLTGTNQSLLVNVTTAVGACALDSDCMAIIDRLDGVRLLWSLLKSNNPLVQASAAWAISPCIEHAKESGEMVRSFVGGLELIVSLLKSDNVDVLASVCAAIANIAKDEENLAVITDHGVVPMLAKLTNTRNDKLRRHLSEAVARCCHWGNNRVSFGTAGAVAPLVKYLRSPDDEVHGSTARALHQLSMDPDNCITMHEHGVVQLLLGMVGSSDPNLQVAAAGTIGNIRRLALASEKAAMGS
ncbi:Armadillo repeat-containing protein 4 [Geranomyces variabilis]|uniref:Armadillo repeat-containing protein 4 n=1 Tax=Geranomyces variabilis TaxID=109894 RepID=A0AAD5TKY0_9FUNG|nr:Armadillo repeat-containing protein 4 [Geranomyces variabilis]